MGAWLPASSLGGASAPGDTTPLRLLVVEDDTHLRLLICRTLRDQGYEVTGVATGAEMRVMLEQTDFQLVVLDVMLPGTSGLDLTRWLRTHSQIPILIVSARGAETDRVVGLELGADDYLPKPFSSAELVARVRALLRRAQGHVIAAEPPSRLLQFNGWGVDQSRRELKAPGGDVVALSGAEYDLLLTLATSPGRVVSREFLLEQSRERIAGASDRSIDVLISRLRAKLGAYEEGKDLIKTVRGAGYMFAADVQRR